MNNNSTQNVLSLIGRLLLVAVFLPAGIGKITGFAGTAGYIASKGLPLPELGVVIAIAVEVLGSVALILGLRTRVAALALAVFTLAASVIFHNYWGVPAEQAFMQQLLFFKNVGVIGGLLILAAFGPGGLSLDARRAD